MKKYVYIGIGGAIGALLRVFAKTIPFSVVFGTKIFSTLLVNLAGSFLLACFMTLAISILDIEPELRLGVATGLMGGLTTFSTLCKEIHTLWIGNHIASALLYGFFSIFFGIIFALLGVLAARMWIGLREEHSI